MHVCAHVYVFVHMCEYCIVEGEEESVHGESGSVTFGKCSCSVMVSSNICVETKKIFNVSQSAIELAILS